MSRVRQIACRLLSPLGKRRRDRQLEEELNTHLALLVEQNIERGMSPQAAHRAAKLSLGGADQVMESVHDQRGLPLLESLWQEIRIAFRMLRKSPGFTAVAVLTLALGIGANTAIFSVVNAVLLRSLPFPNAHRLVDITEYIPGKVDKAGVPFPDYLVWKHQNTVFDEAAAYFRISASNDIVLGGPSSTVRARYSTVTNSFFTILGVQPALGRGFFASDEIPGGPNVFLVSDALWHSLLGGDPRAVGKTYLLDGENFTLLGVMPPGFDFPDGCGIWVPTSTLGESGRHDRISHSYHVLGRLRAGTSLAQAQAQMEAIQEQLAKTYPQTDSKWRVRVQPLRDEIIGNVRNSLLVLLFAVGFILLIACTNVVNLLLARASAREKEFAIRAALGAGRARLYRQNLAEAFLLVGISILFALAVAKWGLALAVPLTSVALPRMESFRLNLPVLAFLTAVAALITVLIGLAPALRASRQHPQGLLQGGQFRGATGWHGRRFRSGLVVSEVALAMLLLCGAGLMLRSFLQLIRVNPGFRTEHLLTMKIALPSGTYPKLSQTAAYLDQLLGRLRALPGVQSVAAASTLPLSGESDWGTFIIEGSSSPGWANQSAAAWRGVSVDYFRTLGIPLLRGREFTPADAKHQDAIIINESMAKKFWPGMDPLGQKIRNRDQRNSLEIIGIVADAKGTSLNREVQPEMYTPLRGFWYAFLLMRTTQDPLSLTPAVREQIEGLDKGVPVYQVATMDRLLSNSVAPQRFDVFLLLLFAALALGLAAVGIYGVLAFKVSQRAHEIGVRMALGAQRGDILRMILAEGMLLASGGIAVGIAGALALTRFLRSMLFEIKPTDPATFAGVAILLAIVALAACYFPARRAMKVDPMVALRYE